MPALSDNSIRPKRILCYGEPRTRKTWWALRAASLGYNVTVLDFNNGLHVSENLPEAERNLIWGIPAWAPEGAEYQQSALATFTKASHGDPVFYDEAARKHVRKTNLTADGEYLRIEMTNAGPNDVIVIDSWTDVAQQTAEFVANRSDVMKLPEYGIEQSEYNKRRMIVDRFLDGLQSLRCHIVFIAHSAEWAKKKATSGPKDQGPEHIDYVRMVPMSVTYAHGQDLVADMSDVLYFTTQNGETYVSTKTNPRYMAGSRTVEPSAKKWGEFGIEKFLPPCPAPSTSFETSIFQQVKGSEASVASNGALKADKTPLLGLGKR